MRIAYLVCALAILLSACDGEKKIKVDVPDVVAVTKTDQHRQFTGTHIFINCPGSYTLVPSLIRFQKNEHVSIQALESRETNFNTKKAELIAGFKKLEERGTALYELKEFKLGNYDAIFAFGADNKPDQDQMALCFGNSNFMVMLAGVLPHKDEKSRKEILQALLSTYVDESATADASQLATFSVDMSGTAFKFRTNVTQMFYYTIDGKGDPVNNAFENSILITSLPPMQDFDARKKYAEDIIERYQNNSQMQLSSIQKRNIKINELDAYEATFNAKYQGKNAKIYQVVLGDGQSTILYVGCAWDNQDKLFGQFKTIAQTLRTKKLQ